MVKDKANFVKEAIVLMGREAVRGITGIWINVSIELKFYIFSRNLFLDLQAVFNNLLPKLLSLLMVLLVWYLMIKLKMQPTSVILIYLVIYFVGILVEFFNTGVTY